MSNVLAYSRKSVRKLKEVTEITCIYPLVIGDCFIRARDC